MIFSVAGPDHYLFSCVSTDAGSTWAQMAQAPVLQVVDRAHGR